MREEVAENGFQPSALQVVQTREVLSHGAEWRGGTHGRSALARVHLRLVFLEAQEAGFFRGGLVRGRQGLVHTGRRFHSASGDVPSSFGTYREVSTRAYLCT